VPVLAVLVQGEATCRHSNEAIDVAVAAALLKLHCVSESAM
jgi:hypothetical protein